MKNRYSSAKIKKPAGAKISALMVRYRLRPPGMVESTLFICHSVKPGADLSLLHPYRSLRVTIVIT